MNLEQFNVKELDKKEQSKIEGGGIFYWFRGFGGFNWANLRMSDGPDLSEVV